MRRSQSPTLFQDKMGQQQLQDAQMLKEADEALSKLNLGSAIELYKKLLGSQEIEISQAASSKLSFINLNLKPERLEALANKVLQEERLSPGRKKQ